MWCGVGVVISPTWPGPSQQYCWPIFNHNFDRNENCCTEERRAPGRSYSYDSNYNARYVRNHTMLGWAGFVQLREDVDPESVSD